MDYTNAKISPLVIRWIARELAGNPCPATCGGCWRLNKVDHTCNLIESAIQDLEDRGVI